MTLNHHIDVGTGMQATGPLEDELPVSESPSSSAILVQGPIYTAAKGSAASVWAEAAVIVEGKFTCVGTLLEATSCCQRFLDKNSGPLFAILPLSIPKCLFENYLTRTQSRHNDKHKNDQYPS